jgi:hypothetical protein
MRIKEKTDEGQTKITMLANNIGTCGTDCCISFNIRGAFKT